MSEKVKTGRQQTVTMADYLRVAEPFIADGLISAETRTKINTVAAQLPPSKVSAFEIALDDPQPEADFLVCYAIKQLLSTALDRVEIHPFWSQMVMLYRQWQQAKPNTPLHAGLQMMTLEYDVASGLPTEHAVPNMYFTEEYPPTPTLAALRQTASEIIDHTSTTQPSAAALANLDRCLRELPPGAELFAIGDMVHRAERSVRFVVRRLPLMAVPAYLIAIGCVIDSAELTNHLRRYEHHTDGIILNLNVDAVVTPKIGIELYVHTADRLGHTEWGSLLQQLEQEGIALPAKAAPLWTGLVSLALTGAISGLPICDAPRHLWVSDKAAFLCAV